MELLGSALEETKQVYLRKRAALKVAINYREMDDDCLTARMISSGIPLNEPHLRARLSRLAKIERTKLRGGKLPISDSFYLMGTADATGGGGIETEGGDREGSIVWCVRCELFGRGEGVASLVGQPEDKGLEVDEKKKQGNCGLPDVSGAWSFWYWAFMLEWASSGNWFYC
ncbi:hypothetical protein KY289_026873 [Solanum tuberosum]|nr:hypothetical protein KY289_026873 [Solanum tuberosum]